MGKKVEKMLGNVLKFTANIVGASSFSYLCTRTKFLVLEESGIKSITAHLQSW